MIQPRALTDVQAAEVKARYAAGATERELAARFEVSRGTITRTLAGLPKRQVGPRVGGLRSTMSTEEIVRRREAGETFQAIATAAGLTRPAVSDRYYAHLRRVGVSQP